MNTRCAEVELTIQASGDVYRLYPEADPIPAGRVAETKRVTFHLRGAGFDLFNTRLLIDGIELDGTALAATHIRWHWDIGFNAGVVDVELRGVRGLHGPFEITTDPDVAKLTRSDYAQMVGDILADTVALVALAGHGLGTARGTRLLDLGRLQLMRRVFSKLEGAVRQIDMAPWSRIERSGKAMPFGQARRATPLELSRATRSTRRISMEQASTLSESGRRLAMTLGGRLPTKVVVAIGRVDTRRREHAEILMVLLMWRHFLSRVSVALSEVPESQAELGAYRELWQRRVRSMMLRLDRLRKLSVFDGVQATRGPISPSLLYRVVPPYRTVHRCYRDFFAGLAEVVGDFLRLPLRKTYELYEIWCFLRLARAAASETGSGDEWKRVFSEIAALGGLVRYIQGRVLDFGGYALVYQPLYREIWKTDGPSLGSFSRAMQPDISLGPRCGADDVRPVIILDAKYRTDQGLNAAVASIHAYRDALVERVGAGDDLRSRRAVVAAFLLTPQSVSGDGGVPWRESRAPEVFLRETYRETFRFGAISAKPGMTIDGARLLLKQLVAIAETSQC